MTVSLCAGTTIALNTAIFVYIKDLRATLVRL
jgi:hypothetical protein